MAEAFYETGTIFSGQLPEWQRKYYEDVLLETLRIKSILVPYCRVKEDFAAVTTGQIGYSEVLDLEPNWNATSETTIWKKGMHLDSRTVSIDLSWYHDIIKYSDHLEVLSYLNGGDTRGIVRDKLGVAMTATLDILARNAHLQHPNIEYMGEATDRSELTSADLFDVDIAEVIRTDLEEEEVPGVSAVEDGAGASILCATTPRVISDIRTAVGSAWLDVQNYQSTGRKFNSEVGTWAGTRFVKSNRLKLWNAGTVEAYTTLADDTEPGQGAAATVDKVYTPGQSNSVRTVEVDDASVFEVGDIVTIHDPAEAGDPVDENDGGQETLRIVFIDEEEGLLSFNKPLLKPHADGDQVTKALNIHATIFFGAPGVVFGIAERPNVIVPPKFDDAMLINRIGWRGMLKFQLFKPEVYRVVLSAASK